MANKFSSLIFTEEGKDVMTKALADKGQMSIINAYTFTVSLTKDLTYSQISGLNPKQTKPMGTVTTDLTTNTVESRLIIDNRDVTADYNLKGIAITGVYGTDNYVLGIINTNETTLVPAYNGQSAQTINLDVSFAISDTSIVTVNTQYAGMLTVADYIALQKYIDQRDAKKADDTTAVHKTGNETINDIKTFMKIIVGSVSGNSGTSDRVNTLAINADVALSSLNNGVYLSTNASKTTSDKPTGAAETYVFVKESNVERFTDISNGQSYFRVKNGSTYTAWNRFSTAAELSNVDASAVHKTGNEMIGGSKTFSSAIIANLQGNADTATKLKTARTISFSGAATGTGTFDGSGNVDIALTESAITRTNTSSAQSLAVGGTVTIIDSITTNTSGEITGVNVKTATMPSVYPPNNDSNLVHKSGAETIGGSKTFTDGLSGALAGNATSATKLANARKINGENFDGTADINVDPVVQVISTNKDVFTLDNGFYYYSNVSATNKPSGSSNYFVVEVIQSGNNGFMQLVDSNNNAWWTTKTGGAWSSWKAVANDALVAHLDTAETFTGKKTFSAGLAGELTGNAATATTLKTARKVGGVSFDGSADINLPGVNTAGNQNTSGNAATATKWAAPRTLALTGDVSGSVKIDGSGDVSIATSGTNLVHKTGAETIAGDKTFTGNLAVSGELDADLTGQVLRLTNPAFSDGWTKANIATLATNATKNNGVYALNGQVVEGIGTNVWGYLRITPIGNATAGYVEITISSATTSITGMDLVNRKLYAYVASSTFAWQYAIDGRGGQRIYGATTLDSLNVTNPINGQLATEPVNILKNTEFNAGAIGWINTNTSGTLEVAASSGSPRVSISTPSAWSGLRQDIPIENLYPGLTYNFSLSLYLYRGTGAASYLVYWTADGTYKAIGIGSALTTTGTWTTLNKDIVIPSDAVKFAFDVQATGANSIFYVKQPQVTYGAGQKPYVSGSDIQDMTSGTSDASFRNLNVSGTISSTDTYLRVGKPILSPIISSSVVMWYGWKVYYYVHNGVVTYQIQTNSSTIPIGTKSNEKLPAAARPIYKTFVPLAYGGQGFAINIDGTFENYTGVEISGASWASATSHVLNL
ncbi:beta strand repeat-containing protein [Weissella confusa]|uniref:beta strand repeat-containing protein n=1 Tax=Weissella confusa TaxID=1583 RepID=UPI0018F1A17E|nr:pyocin knob domain-containing protein [Weissella confusa]MBJ7671890.1 hypothetical protein [Weissella confusa]